MMDDTKRQYLPGKVRPWMVLAFLSILLAAYGMYSGEPGSVYNNARIICTSCIGIR